MKAFFSGLAPSELRLLLGTPQGRSLTRLALRHAAAGRHQPRNLRYRGLRLRVPDVLAFLWQAQDIWVNENYRFTPANAAPLVLDCGANAGVAAAWFARKYPLAQIHSFEADPQVFALLQQNVAHNGLAAQVTTHHAAVWVDRQGVRFAADGADGGHISEQGSQVPSVRLRDVLAAHPSVDLLKLDIEGAETAVLRDCADLLAQVRHLFVEYHSYGGQPQSLDVVLAILTHAGFRYRLVARPNLKRQRWPLQPSPLLAGMDLNADVFAYRPALPTRTGT